MKKLTKIISLGIVFLLGSSCSGNKEGQTSNEFETSDQLFAESMSVSEPVASDLEASRVEIAESPVIPAYEAPVQIEEVVNPVAEAPLQYKNDPGVYEVRRGDTWMIIAQKLLGNPLKWRQIQRMNKEFKKSSDLYVGAKLTYTPPEKPIVEPDGLPYLIKNADTLPKISKKVYGTKNQWDVIYFNNREIIQSPDMIYSGFMLYYPEVERVPMVKIEMAQMNFKVRSPRKPASVKVKK